MNTQASRDEASADAVLSDALRRRLCELHAQAAGRAEGTLMSLTVAAPEAADARGCTLPERGFAWSRPVGQQDLAGCGTATRIAAAGEERFETLAAAHRRLAADWAQDGPATAPDARIAFVGFCFDPHEQPGPEWHGLANAELVVPTVLLHRRRGRAWLTFTTATGGGAWTVDPDTWLARAARLLARETEQVPDRRTTPLLLEPLPEEPDWRARIDDALTDIGDGRLEKVVLTRRVRYAGTRPVDCARVFRALEAEHPDCAAYAVTSRGFTLLGVSPERLVSLEGDLVTVDALAGTAPRHPDQAADSELAHQMLDDPKTRREHRLVRDRIVRALQPACVGLEAPPAPGLMKLPRVQHLWSPIRGRVRPGESLLSLAARLHPTPAVGGSPGDAALAWLADRENGRGWYTGACGWIGAAGGGELVVVLRCGVVNERQVDLYAGAGIVMGSLAERELAETEWKLMTMRGALQFG